MAIQIQGAIVAPIAVFCRVVATRSPQLRLARSLLNMDELVRWWDFERGLASLRSVAEGSP